MVAYMEQVRAALLAERKAEQLRNWVVARLLPPYTAYIRSRPATVSSLPSLKQLALAKEIMPHLQANVGALENDIQANALQEALERIPELVQNHSNEVEEYLLNLVRRSPPYDGQTIDRSALFYATTMFHCSKCDTSLAFLDVLVHHDFYTETVPLRRKRRGSSNKRKAEADAEADVDIEAGIQRAFKDYAIWTPGKAIRFNEAAYRHTLSVLNSLQMDPLTTCQTLRVLNPYLELLCKCRDKYSSNPKQNRVINRWSEIVSISSCRRVDLTRSMLPPSFRFK